MEYLTLNSKNKVVNKRAKPFDSFIEGIARSISEQQKDRSNFEYSTNVCYSEITDNNPRSIHAENYSMVKSNFTRIKISIHQRNGYAFIYTYNLSTCETSLYMCGLFNGIMHNVIKTIARPIQIDQENVEYNDDIIFEQGRKICYMKYLIVHKKDIIKTSKLVLDNLRIDREREEKRIRTNFKDLNELYDKLEFLTK